MKEKSFLDTLKKKDGKYIIPLDVPIEYGKEKITELVASEPKAKHIRSLPSNPSVGDSLDMMGELCEVAGSVIDELSLKDVAKVSEFIEAFS